MSTSHLQPVSDLSQVAEARRSAAQFAERLKFNEGAASNLAIVVTELATNLAIHAGGGKLLYRALGKEANESGVEVLSIDAGPGMANVNECMRDGYSTAGTPGNGLGAVRRLSRLFDVYSRPQLGTVIVAQVWPVAVGTSNPSDAKVGRPTALGAVSLAVQGEVECGDSWSRCATPGMTNLLVIDGLGHGVLAAQAAEAGVKAFETPAVRTAKMHISTINDALRPTRGAAGAVAVIDHDRGTLSYCGMGNITSAISSDDADRHLVSQNGILGHDAKSLHEFTYPWSTSSLLVMASDGLTSRWSLKAYPGIRARHPSLIAGVLYRDHCRGRDDVTVVVFREGQA